MFSPLLYCIIPSIISSYENRCLDVLIYCVNQTRVNNALHVVGEDKNVSMRVAWQFPGKLDGARQYLTL
jgi:hypothetical protein